MKTLPPSAARAAAFLFAALAPLSSYAAALSWDGGGSDNNWNTSANWNPDTALGSTDTLTFGDTDKTSSDTANNIVSANQTITSLTYANSGATSAEWQVTEIASGQTLSIGTASATGILNTGVSSAANLTTNAKITGAGSLQLGVSSRLATFGFTSGSTSVTAYARPTLDLSGLASFTAFTSTFNVGGGISLATLNLAQTNAITANTLTVGTNSKNTSTGAGSNSVLNLGAANTLHATTLIVGNTSSRTGGTLQFASTGGSVTIRGTAGGSTRANLTIGQGGDGSVNITNIVDFTGNTVDALFGTLIVGGSNAGNAGFTTAGQFSMSAGTVDATTVIVGKQSGGNATASGTLNISGGTFSAGSVELGSTTSATRPANATLNITGGTFTSAGNIAEGASSGGIVTSTVTLNGGTLDLGGHAVTVDTFNVQAGTLKNLGQFNSGATLTKTTAGALILDGANTYTGNTSVGAGSLTLAATGSLTFYLGADGISNKVTGAGTATFDGTFGFDLTNAVLSEGNTWTITDVSTQSFTSTFAVSGFTDGDLDGVWTNGAGLSFSEATGILSYSAIPEPSTFALLGGLSALAAIALRRRRA